jgi:A/G-specific adenine glycosylase
MSDFKLLITDWYRQNKRDLPWRETKDPFRIWLSEVILQQTRVQQGLPYYLKFTEHFSDVNALAAADEQLVLNLWQGLGYYSRGRNLHQTAKIISNELKGEFPLNSEGLQKLKGIGPYTAAAIASFCYNEPVPVIDGNVSRVLSRVFDIEEPINSTQGEKTIRSLATSLIDFNDPATYNQAIMEFGALKCTPLSIGRNMHGKSKEDYRSKTRQT